MEDDLPTLPPSQPSPTTTQFPATLPTHPTKKRVRHSSFTALSSDPAIFSSDDNDPSAENYLFARRKKKFRGPWYEQVPASDGVNYQENTGTDGGKEKKGSGLRKFERKYDSGVFMGSDGTDFDELEGIVEADMVKESRGVELGLRKGWREPLLVKRRDGQEVLVESVVERCLEEGNESIDLS